VSTSWSQKFLNLCSKLRSSETKKNTRFFPLKLVEDKLADRVNESLESGLMRPGVGASDLLETLIRIGPFTTNPIPTLDGPWNRRLVWFV
jgi:hypothetical protein